MTSSPQVLCNRLAAPPIPVMQQDGLLLNSELLPDLLDVRNELQQLLLTCMDADNNCESLAAIRYRKRPSTANTDTEDCAAQTPWPQNMCENPMLLQGSLSFHSSRLSEESEMLGAILDYPALPSMEAGTLVESSQRSQEKSWATERSTLEQRLLTNLMSVFNCFGLLV